jgi:hypothetical protein
MAVTYKVLGQVCPANVNVLTPLYTVPANTETVVSSIVINDVGNAGGGFAVAIAVAGAADTIAQYIYGSPSVGAFMDQDDTFVATIGITLGPGDVVNVRNISAAASELTFQLFGSEIS